MFSSTFSWVHHRSVCVIVSDLSIYIYIYIYIVVVWRTRASTWERLLYSSEACSLLHGQKRLIVVSPTLSHGDASSKVVHVLWFSVVWRRPSFFFPLFSLSYMASGCASAKQKLKCVLSFYFYFSYSPIFLLIFENIRSFFYWFFSFNFIP
jgi:hypothetical protein